MRFVVSKSRVIAMGIVFAVAGFTYAVSTAPESGIGVGVRAVGSTQALRFTNPLLANGALGADEYDLGDAAFGSAVVRYVTADGGLKPYRFTSEGTLGFANVIAGLKTDLQFGISGLLAGSAPPKNVDPITKAVLPFPNKTAEGKDGLRFQVTVKDAKGTNPETKTGFYNLAFYDATGIFRFAHDTLPSGRLADNYIASVDVLGGAPPYVFSLVSVSTVSGTAATSMETLGLFLTNDGHLIGRPLVAGSYLLRVRCTDARKAVANNRSNSGQDQSFVLTILDNPVTDTSLITSSCRVRGDTSRGAGDSLLYKGFINVLGQDNFTLLNSDFTFRFRSITVSGRLDNQGRFAAVLADQSKVNVKVDHAKGTVQVSISKGTFTKALGFDVTPPKTGLTREAVEVSVGDAVSATEVLDLETDVSGTKYTLNYKLGSAGASAAGAFQVVSVKGKDANTASGQPGDEWRAKFVAAARSGVTDTSGKQGLTGVTGVTVRVGLNFVQALPTAGIRSSGDTVKFRGGPTGVKSFSFSARNGKGTVNTNALSSVSTGIPVAGQSIRAANVFFPLGIDLARGTGNAPFSGEHARRIFGFQTQYRDQAPAR